MDEITIGFAQMDDVPSWMALVKSVRWNFPGLETEEGLVDYQKTLSKNIARKTAICAKTGDKVVGALIYSKKQNILGCLCG